MKLILPVIILLFLHCSIFELRKSEAPTALSGPFAENYLEVVPLLEEALRLGNSDKASMLFDNGFRFIADSTDSAYMQAPYRSWGRAEEINALKILLATPPKSISSTILPLFVKNDSSVIQWEYELLFDTLPVLKGISEIETVNNGGYWYIVAWRDRKTLSNKSIGLWHMETIFK